jgi:hypothetical protein
MCHRYLVFDHNKPLMIFKTLSQRERYRKKNVKIIRNNIDVDKQILVHCIGLEFERELRFRCFFCSHIIACLAVLL